MDEHQKNLLDKYENIMLLEAFQAEPLLWVTGRKPRKARYGDCHIQHAFYQGPVRRKNTGREERWIISVFYSDRCTFTFLVVHQPWKEYKKPLKASN